MKKLKAIIATSVVNALMMSTVTAAQLQVEWFEPEKYFDVYPGTENKMTYQKEVFSSLEKHLGKLAETLPKDYTLLMRVYNLDLAGHITFYGSRKARVVEDSMPPRMQFAYQLLDNNRQVLKSENVDIKTKDLKNRRAPRAGRPLYLEMGMLDKWFNENFSDVKI